MILSCPACATRYTIDESKLGPGGRTVRCAACRNTWHAEPAAALIELPLTSPVKETVEDLQSVKADKVPLKYRAMVEDRKRAKAMTAQGIVWAVMGAAAVLILALAFFLRVNIVQAFPRVAGAYAMAGLKTYGTPLVFAANDAQAKLKGGRFVVTVKAQIKNTSDKPAAVPAVKVTLLDGSPHVFDTKIMPGGGLIVPPHAMRTLVFDVPDPSNMAAHVDVAFELEGAKDKGKSKSHSGGHGETAHTKVHAAPGDEEPAHGDAGNDSGHEDAQADAHADDGGHGEPAHGAATEIADAGELLQAPDASAGHATAEAEHAAPHVAEPAHAPALALKPAVH